MPASHGSGPQTRTAFLDWLRLIATFQMVQGHTIDALLATAERNGPVFAAWTWARGLTAVAFLFVAGYSYSVATLSRVDAHLADRNAVRRRFRRALLLIAIGYLLHAPLIAPFVEAEDARAALAEALIVDVLQCIGVTLLVLEGITLLLRSRLLVAMVAGVAALAALALAPWTEAIRSDGPLAPLLHYVTTNGGSLFPLIPWSGYMFAGVAVAALIEAPAGRYASWRERPLRLTPIVVACALLTWLMPGFIPIERLAAVMVAALLVALVAGAHPPRGALAIVARETLVIYVFHVCILYAAGIGLVYVVGPVLAPGSAILAALAVSLVSAAVALLVRRIRGPRASSPTLAGPLGTG